MHPFREGAGVFDAVLGERGVAADLLGEVVLALPVAGEADGLGGGVEVHDEGGDAPGEVAENLVENHLLAAVDRVCV